MWLANTHFWVVSTGTHPRLSPSVNTEVGFLTLSFSLSLSLSPKQALGIPCFLGGMSRGLLGRRSEIQVRQQRRDALKEADVVILAGRFADVYLTASSSLCYGCSLLLCILSLQASVFTLRVAG